MSRSPWSVCSGCRSNWIRSSDRRGLDRTQPDTSQIRSRSISTLGLSVGKKSARIAHRSPVRTRQGWSRTKRPRRSQARTFTGFWVLGSGLGVGVSDPLRRAAGLAIAYPVRSLSVAGSHESLLANNPGTRRSQFEFPAQPVNPGLSKGISDNLPGVRGCVPLQCWREWIQQLAESGSVVPNVPREESSLLRNKHSEPAKSPPAKRATRENWKVSCLIFNNAAPIQICEKPALPKPIT